MFVNYNSDFTLEIKSLENNGFFTGYASVFSYVDSQNDFIKHGAFRRTIAEHNGGKSIKLLWQHEPKEPIGVFEEISEDEYGLYVRGKLLLEVQKAKEAYTLLKSGAVNDLSIGYNVKQYNIDAESCIRFIYDLDLYEISLVTFPANNLANVTSVKADVEENFPQTELIKLCDMIDDAHASIQQ